jgi:hypothetical protein
VGHVHALRLAPFRDDVAFVDDDAGLFAAVLDRTDGIAERLAAEVLVVIQNEVARVLRLGCDRVVDRLLQEARVDPGFGRRLPRPFSLGKIRSGSEGVFFHAHGRLQFCL